MYAIASDMQHLHTTSPNADNGPEQSDTEHQRSAGGKTTRVLVGTIGYCVGTIRYCAGTIRSRTTDPSSRTRGTEGRPKDNPPQPFVLQPRRPRNTAALHTMPEHAHLIA